MTHQAKNQILLLRSQGLSIKTIAKMLGCAKSTVSYHCIANQVGGVRTRLTPEARRENAKKGSQIAKMKWENAKAAIICEATNEWPIIKQNPKMMGFLGLYWGEGDKRSSCVGIVNNDPGIIKAALEIFRLMSPNASIKVVIRCYPEHDLSKCSTFWQNALNIPVKTRSKTWLGKLRRMYSIFGLCTVQFSDWKVKHKILTWLKLWRQDMGIFI